jgi:two-component system OmpR family sensor kinase
MSLRVRLLLGLLAVALVLVGADVVVATTVRRTLVDQVDRRVTSAVSRASRSSLDAGGVDSSREATSGARGTGSGSPSLSELFVAYLGPDGSVVSQIPPTLRDETPPQLDPATVSGRATESGDAPRVFTAGAEQGSDLHYRVAVVRLADQSGFAVVGVSLQETDATYHRLLLVLGLSTAAVLLVLTVVAFWVIRLGIRPIDRMAVTADAIAAGDVSRRVEVGPEGTEVGRLGVALNAMLHQIEWAFAQRRASEERLRRFVADASHELRTPLTSIRGYVELYQTGAVGPGPELDDAMRRVAAESARMSVLVDDLLLLARLDQGRPLDRHPADLRVVARDAVADARAVEPERPIGLELPDSAVRVEADEQGLHQAVANLLVNVRAHTSAGTPVYVRLSTLAGQARIEVVDQGPGITPEEVERIFERFYRGDPARARSGPGGAGLGLSIVAAMAAAHGGRAWAESSGGQGATFVIELPLLGSPPPAGARHSQEVPNPF